MEVSAAVYAADRMCAHSQRFCAIISGKLAFMVRDSKTPLPLKRRLIRIFGHMFEDIALARLARKTCLDILDMNQDGEYTVSILRTLTRLASHSLVDVDQQIGLLLEMAQSHPLQGIRRVSLICLGSLAQKHIDFSPEQIKVHSCFQGRPFFYGNNCPNFVKMYVNTFTCSPCRTFSKLPLIQRTTNRLSGQSVLCIRYFGLQV